MSKIAFIIPYYGSLPNYFDLWLLSVKENKAIDFFLITDIKIEKEKCPDNVYIISESFSKLRGKFKDIFGSDIRLESPYKICDYRPAFGMIFEDLLTGYDFWGYCDMDLIFGDIRKFVTEDLLQKHKKLYSHGHFVLVKNIKQMNTLFMKNHKFTAFTFDEIKTTDLATHFDEWRGFSVICQQSGIPIHEGREDYCDINYYNHQFRLVNHDAQKRPQILKWHNGKLFLIYSQNNSIVQKEYMYVHLQKRTMKNETKRPEEGFLIVPNSFIDDTMTIDPKAIQNLGRKKGFYKRKYVNLSREITHNLRFGGIKYRIKLWKKNRRFKGANFG